MQNETFREYEETEYFVRSLLEKRAAARIGCLSSWSRRVQHVARPTGMAKRPVGKRELKDKNSENNSEFSRTNVTVI
jgi:hypothetical protein